MLAKQAAASCCCLGTGQGWMSDSSIGTATSQMCRMCWLDIAASCPTAITSGFSACFAHLCALAGLTTQLHRLERFELCLVLYFDCQRPCIHRMKSLCRTKPFPENCKDRFILTLRPSGCS